MKHLINLIQDFILLFLDEFLQGLNESIPLRLVVSIRSITNQNIAVNSWVREKEFPKHSALNVKFTLLTVVMNNRLVHHTFIALRYKCDYKVQENYQNHYLINDPNKVNNNYNNLIKWLVSDRELKLAFSMLLQLFIRSHHVLPVVKCWWLDIADRILKSVEDHSHHNR